MKALPINDYTNACAFFSVSIAERILHESKIDDFFENLPYAVESTIWSLPAKIYNHRGLEKIMTPWKHMIFFTACAAQHKANVTSRTRGAEVPRSIAYIYMHLTFLDRVIIKSLESTSTSEDRNL